MNAEDQGQGLQAPAAAAAIEVAAAEAAEPAAAAVPAAGDGAVLPDKGWDVCGIC